MSTLKDVEKLSGVRIEVTPGSPYGSLVAYAILCSDNGELSIEEFDEKIVEVLCRLSVTVAEIYPIRAYQAFATVLESYRKRLAYADEVLKQQISDMPIEEVEKELTSMGIDLTDHKEKLREMLQDINRGRFA